MTKSSKAAPVIFEDVTKKFGNTIAVDRLNFTIEAGEMVTLLGPSGCGKTTTLRLVSGLEQATSGTIKIGDRDVTQLPATDRDVTMVFQSYALFPHMTVAENVAYGLRVGGMSAAEGREEAEAGLRQVGLEGYGERLPSELSGGQQQRVAVARAVVTNPELILADEPTGNLDTVNGEEVLDLLNQLNDDGTTIVMVTHDQGHADHASRTVNMLDGRVLSENVIGIAATGEARHA